MIDPANSVSVSCVICEDEPIAAKALQDYLRDVAWIDLVGLARNGSEAVRLINKLEPQLLFLDVQMPGLTGLEVLDRLTSQPAIIFTTAYSEYALPAFEYGAVDYLLKPFGAKRLLQALDRIRVKLVGEGLVGTSNPERSRANFSTRLFVRYRDSIVPIPANEIIRVDAAAGGASLHTSEGKFHLDRTLAEVESRLDPNEFVRVHRGHLVNLAQVKEIRRYDERRLLVELSDGSTLITSRPGAKTLRELMG